MNFYTTMASWRSDYARKNPGIILDIRPNRYSGVAVQQSAKIMWANGSVTCEHASFLEVVNDS